MKILDRYVARSFLTGYAIMFCVFIGLMVMIDLFVNLDEFAEHLEDENVGILGVLKNIGRYYGIHISLYYRDMASMIMVVAAAFSLGRMVRNNELVAMMTSGLSLKRVICPIILLSIILSGILVVNQEIIIPHFSDELVRSHDDKPGEESYDVWFISDANENLVCSQRYFEKTMTLRFPTIITRKEKPNSPILEITGRIDADKAIFEPETNRWKLINGTFTSKDASVPSQPMEYFYTDLTARDIPIRRQAGFKTLLSSRQLSQLASQKHKIKDLAQLQSQKHFRVTEPLMNIVILLVCLPILVCRDTKAMKSAVMVSFTLTGMAMATMFACKLLAAEKTFGQFIPHFWAWLPIFIWTPIAFVAVDTMKT